MSSSSVFRMVSSLVSTSRSASSNGDDEDNDMMALLRTGSNDSEDSNESTSPTPASPPPDNMPLFNDYAPQKSDNNSAHPPFAEVITQPEPPSQLSEASITANNDWMAPNKETNVAATQQQPLFQNQPSTAAPERKGRSTHPTSETTSTATRSARQSLTPSRRSKRVRTPSAKKKESIESAQCFSSSRRRKSPGRPKAPDLDASSKTEKEEARVDVSFSNKVAEEETSAVTTTTTKSTIEAGFKRTNTGTVRRERKMPPTPIQTPSPSVELLNVELLATPTQSALRRLKNETSHANDDSSNDLVWSSTAAATPATYFGESPLMDGTPPPRRNARVRTPFAKARLQLERDEEEDASPWVAVQSAPIDSLVTVLNGNASKSYSFTPLKKPEPEAQPKESTQKQLMPSGSPSTQANSTKKMEMPSSTRKRKASVEPGSLRRSSRRASLSSTYASPSITLFQENETSRRLNVSVDSELLLGSDSFRGLSPIDAAASSKHRSSSTKPPKPPKLTYESDTSVDQESSHKRRRSSRRATLSCEARQSPAFSVELDILKQKATGKRGSAERPKSASKRDDSPAAESVNSSRSRSAQDEHQGKSRSSSSRRPSLSGSKKTTADESPAESIRSSKSIGSAASDSKRRGKRQSSRRATLSTLAPGESPACSDTAMDAGNKSAKRSRDVRRPSLSSASGSSPRRGPPKDDSISSLGNSSTISIVFDDDEKPVKKRRKSLRSTPKLKKAWESKGTSSCFQSTESSGKATMTPNVASSSSSKNALPPLPSSTASAPTSTTSTAKPGRRLSTFKLPPLPSSTLSTNRKSRRTSLATGSPIVFESAGTSSPKKRDPSSDKEAPVTTRRSPRRLESKETVSSASLEAKQHSEDDLKTDVNDATAGALHVLNPIDMNKSSSNTPSKLRRSPRKKTPSTRSGLTNTPAKTENESSYGHLKRSASSRRRLMGSAEKPTVKATDKQIIPAKTISTKASRMFANSRIARETCVSARLFACFDLSQPNVSIELSDIPARRAQSNVVAPLMQLMSCIVRLEMTSLEGSDSSTSRKVHFSGFDCSSVKPPVDSQAGSQSHQEDCIVLLVLAALQIQSIADGRLNEGEKLYDHSSLDVSLGCLIQFLDEMLANTSLKAECAKSIDPAYPPQRLDTAIALYKGDFECILKRLNASSSTPSLDSTTFMERRLAEFTGQSIRFHLRKLFNPPPLPLTKQPSEDDSNENTLDKAKQSSTEERHSSVFELVELTLPDATRDSAVADGSISSLFSLALRVIFHFFGADAFKGPITADDTIPLPSSFCSSPASQRGLGNPKNPIKYMSQEDLSELVGEVAEVYDFLAAYNACKFMSGLLRAPKVSKELESMGGWSSIENHAKTLVDLKLGNTCWEDSHFSAIAHARSMKHLIDKVENWLSHMAPKVTLAELSIKQLAKRYKTKASSPKQRNAIFRKFPHVKVIAEAIEDGRVRANAFPLVKSTALSS